MQKLFQAGLSQCISGFSHFVAPSKQWFGQRLVGVGSAVGPRSIIGGIA
jgi:hypothetical protein